MQKEADKIRNRAMRRGAEGRNRARNQALKRKEEYLGARVPKELRDKVIRRADALGMQVSILIRSILEQATRSWEADEAGTSRGPTDAVGNRSASTVGAEQFPEVLGWEEIKLNKSVNCGVCSIRLEPGSIVTLGLAGPGEEHVVLCQRCKQVT
jgi:hypothetical protein